MICFQGFDFLRQFTNHFFHVLKLGLKFNRIVFKVIIITTASRAIIMDMIVEIAAAAMLVFTKLFAEIEMVRIVIRL